MWASINLDGAESSDANQDGAVNESELGIVILIFDPRPVTNVHVDISSDRFASVCLGLIWCLRHYGDFVARHMQLAR